ncbi:MAG: hypothetical protein E7292_07425 [Lachnospiraceae bacterium]|nr:hypothetical protein [Lachnospiraceae bacterium]
MKYLTGYYWSADKNTAFVLVHARRIGDGLPIMMMGICDPFEDTVIENFKNMLLEWFDRQGLHHCGKGGASKCIRLVGKSFVKWFAADGGNNKDADTWKNVSWCVFVTVGEECFYAWNGDGEIRLLNLCFNRLNSRKLTWHTDKMQLEYAGLEPGVGILLGTKSLFEYLPEKSLKECLAIETIDNKGQIQKHLKEAVLEAAYRGAEVSGAVLAVTKEAQ